MIDRTIINAPIIFLANFSFNMSPLDRFLMIRIEILAIASMA